MLTTTWVQVIKAVLLLSGARISGVVDAVGLIILSTAVWLDTLGISGASDH